MTPLSFRETFQETPTILSRIALEDKNAAHECVEIYGAMIWALVKQSVDSTEAAEKVVQEIFLDIWQNAVFCDLKLSDEKVWIAMIARRRLSGLAMRNAGMPNKSADYMVFDESVVH